MFSKRLCREEWEYLQRRGTGSPSIKNGAHGTEKILLKTQVTEDFANWSESNNTILQWKIKISTKLRYKYSYTWFTKNNYDGVIKLTCS